MSTEVRVHDHSTTEDPAWPIAGDKDSKAMYVGLWHYDHVEKKWQRASPLNIDEVFNRDLLQQVLVELKILNLHMATLSDNIIKEEDII
jgi:hypothetical protein